MTHLTEDPGVLAGTTGADESGKIKHSRIHNYHSVPNPATHYHDLASGSVERLALHWGALV